MWIIFELITSMIPNSWKVQFLLPSTKLLMMEQIIQSSREIIKDQTDRIFALKKSDKRFFHKQDSQPIQRY